MASHSTSGAEGVQKTQIKDLFGFPSGAIGVQFKIGFLKHSNKRHVLKLTPMGFTLLYPTYEIMQYNHIEWYKLF